MNDFTLINEGGEKSRSSLRLEYLPVMKHEK